MSQQPFDEASAPMEGQFYFVPKPQPKTFAKLALGIPVALAVLSAGVITAGYSYLGQQSQNTATELSPSPIPTAQASSTVEPSPIATFSTAPSPEPSPVDQLSTTVQPSPAAEIDQLPIVRINAPGLLINFRKAPSLTAQVLNVIETQTLVETTGKRVDQEGIIWRQIRHQQQLGWVADKFVEAR